MDDGGSQESGGRRQDRRSAREAYKEPTTQTDESNGALQLSGRLT